MLLYINIHNEYMAKLVIVSEPIQANVLITMITVFLIASCVVVTCVATVDRDVDRDVDRGLDPRNFLSPLGSIRGSSAVGECVNILKNRRCSCKVCFIKLPAALTYRIMMLIVCMRCG